MKVVAQFCEERPDSNLLKLLPDLYADDSMYETMIDVGPDFNETFILCKMFDRWIDCGEILFRTMSESGFCQSFNTIRLEELFTDQ